MKKTLKQRVRSGDPINVVNAPICASTKRIKEIVENHEDLDAIYVDAQHTPYSESDLANTCRIAADFGVPIQVRIKHWRHAYLIGTYLDLGPLSIKIPEVETEDVVDEAIEAFYYPPMGRRSWGSGLRYKCHEIKDRIEYATWWNNNGILGFKIESIKAVLNVRKLIKPGIDYVDFGPMDLSFDLEKHRHPDLKTVGDCVAFVRNELKDVDVRVS